MKTEALSASLEDYLETIYSLSRKKQAARSKDISAKLRVNSSSVTGALRSLSEKKMVNYSPYDIVTLTPMGERIAKNVFHRHTVIKDFFVRVLGVDGESAEESACRMEHSISKEILDRLADFVELIKSCPHAESPADCEHCIRERLENAREKKG